MTELQVDVDLPYPPELVWRALVDPRLLGEWWLPVDLAPQEGESFRAFPPSQTPVLPAELDVDVLRAEKPSLMSQRWSGDELHTHVTWEISPQPHGSRLRFTQQGFFGIDGKQRRLSLRDLYITMLTKRLPETLNRAGGAILAPTTELPRLVSMTDDELDDEPQFLPPQRQRRRRLLIGAAVLIAALALGAALYPAGEDSPAGAPSPSGTGQPPVTASSAEASSSATPSAVPPTGSPSGTPGPASPSPQATPPPAGPPLTATYRTVTLLGLGGFDTEVTVRNPGSSDRPGWTVVLVMPDGTAVTNKTPGDVEVSQQADVVTVKPVPGKTLPANGSVTFTVGRPGLIAAGSAKSCTIDSTPCG